MDNAFKLLAAVEEQKSYNANVDLGTTEYAITEQPYRGTKWQFLSMPGSNEFWDWALNFFLWSKKGVKYCSYKAADEVYKAVKDKINPDLPLCVVGHSKAGPDALQYMDKYGADRCIAFCPPPAFRPWNVPTFDRKTLMVIDPDDLVPWAGRVSFRHANAMIEKLPNDKRWYDLSRFASDHVIDHIVAYYEGKVNY